MANAQRFVSPPFLLNNPVAICAAWSTLMTMIIKTGLWSIEQTHVYPDGREICSLAGVGPLDSENLESLMPIFTMPPLVMPTEQAIPVPSILGLKSQKYETYNIVCEIERFEKV